MRPSAVAEPFRTAGISISRDSRTKKPQSAGKSLHIATVPGAPDVNASNDAFLHDQDPMATAMVAAIASNIFR
jgi:hypothetical protein